MTKRWLQAGLAGSMLVVATAIPTQGWAQVSSPVFASTNVVEIRDGLPASPYPSTVVVSNVSGVILRTTVVLNNLNHRFPDDVDVILVSPSQHHVMLMSDVGGGTDVTNLVLTFSDFAPGNLPDRTALFSGVYRPTNYELNDAVLPPAPAGPHGQSLTAFNGNSPNGLWSLYILDDAGSDAGSLAGGWSLQFETVNPLTTADLAVGVLGAAGTVRAGDLLSFSVNVTNLGPNIAGDVRLRVAVPESVVVGPMDPDLGSCTLSGTLVTCDLGVVGVGERRKITIGMTPILPITITNSFSVAGFGADLGPFNSFQDVVTVVTPADVADLEVDITDGPDPSNVGANYSYQIVVTNAGPLGATGVMLTNRLPANVTFVGSSSSQGSCQRLLNQVICSLGALPAGTNAVVDIIVSGNLIGVVTNFVTVRATEPDLTPAMAQEMTSINLPSDLSVFQVDSVDPAGVGSNLTYSITIENSGPGRSTGVILMDTLPLEATFVSAVASQGVCVFVDGVVICSLGDLDVGEVAEVSLTVVPTILGSFINTAQVSGNEDEFELQNNLSTERTTVFPTIGDGILITPTTNALELATAVTAAGSSGILVRETRLQAHAFPRITNFFSGEVIMPTSSGLYTVANPPFTYGLMGLGVVLSSGDVNDYNSGPNLFGSQTFSYGVGATTNQEALLDPITASNGRTFRHNDVTQLDITFDLLAGFDSVQFDVVFGSEEYPVFVNSSFIDGFGIYLNGRNIAFTEGNPININHPDMKPIPGTELNGVVAPGDNPVLTFTAFVGSGTTNNLLTFIVSDTSDTALDTTVFVASLQGAAEPNSDLAVTSSVSSERLEVGREVTYTLTVTNQGPDTATSVEVNNHLPGGVDFVSAVPSRGTCTLVEPGRLICEIVSLGNANSATIRVAGVVREEGLKTNRVSVSASQLDFVPANNEATTVGLALNPGTFISGESITLFDGAPAGPYPSSISVSNMSGVITQVVVALVGIDHSFAADLDVLVQAPDGRAVLLMSDAGGNTRLEGAVLVFMDGAPELLPASAGIVSGGYRPTDYSPAELFPAPAPGGPHGTRLSVLNGINPNGIWNLYCYDDLGGDSGLVADGWRLELGTAPAGPTLHLAFDGVVVVVSWAGAAGAYLLEESPGLGPLATWTGVAASPVAVNGTNRVTLIVGSGSHYYRLRRSGL